MSKKSETNKTAETEEATNLPAVQGNSGNLAEMPSFMSAEDFGNDAGFEGIDKDSYAIPFIQILQKMSPRVDEDNPAYIQGAKPGMLYNTVTGQLYDGKAGVLLVPCAYKRTYIQWGGREGDGGFKGEFNVDVIDTMIANKEVSALKGKYFLPDEKGIIHEKKSDFFADTRSHFVLLIDPETGISGMAVVALASTQIKASKTLMTLLNQKRVNTAQGKRMPPTFANLVRMTTIPMSNEQGSWSGAKFVLEGMVADAELFNEAKEFWRAVNGGKVKADHSKSETQHSDEGEGVGEGGTADNF